MVLRKKLCNIVKQISKHPEPIFSIIREIDVQAVSVGESVDFRLQ